jgi:MFS family permease
MHRIFALLREHKHAFSGHRIFWLYIALIFLSLHWACVVYVNSSFLETFFTSSQVSLLYAVSSLASLLCFFYTPSVLRVVGNYRLTCGFVLLELAALCGLALAQTPVEAACYFLLHMISVPILLFSIDVFLESIEGKSEVHTGSLYGLKLTLLSLGLALSQLFVGSIIDVSTSFEYVYLVSALLLLPFLILVHLTTRTFKDPSYIRLSMPTMWNTLRIERDIRKIVCISFFLQLFFSAMVIFAPLYLFSVVGLSWTQIGSILFVGLCAYVLFEWPIGIIADRYIGEKEMMAVGFTVMIVATSWFAFLSSASIALWMIAVFLSRTGASLVEATVESYFFKHAGSNDTHKISMFRMTNPLASIAGAGIGSVSLLFVPLQLFFIILALCMVPGLLLTLFLTDTK